MKLRNRIRRHEILFDHTSVEMSRSASIAWYREKHIDSRRNFDRTGSDEGHEHVLSRLFKVVQFVIILKCHQRDCKIDSVLL